MQSNHPISRENAAVTRTPESLLATNKVLRNTYLLLSMTLLFSAATAGVAMAFGLPHPGLLLTLVGYFGLLFATTRFRDSALGLVFVFALTGFMGYSSIVPSRLRHVCLSGLGDHSLADQRHHPRWRDQLHHGHRYPVRVHLQSVSQPVADSGCHGWR